MECMNDPMYQELSLQLVQSPNPQQIAEINVYIKKKYDLHS